DIIAELHDFGPVKKAFQGWTQEGRIGSEKILLLKPATFMNESGRSVGEAMRFYKLDTGDVTVFHDELDLDPFRVKVKTGGGTAGHNGLRST
ncbi:aminoacyl-tRNA hydrolase, partial [Pseudomonas sp. GP01-A4]|uniref:aminoacyl-tRNA hydrolase n=2 Tax=Pseudomonadota TaxID=1224 RepID=UPI000CB5277B